jgi:hypothetical protein
LCLAYYDNPMMLHEQFDRLSMLDPRWRDLITLHVVDDGSPRWPAAQAVAEWCCSRGMELLPSKLRAWRMDEDIPWNQDACRNLAVMQAETGGWCLMTDMDHVPSPELWEHLLKSKLDTRCAYIPARLSMPERTRYHAHPNSYAMTKATFKAAGGYDERFRGIYGTDGMFKGRVGAAARIVELKEPLIRYPREVIADASTTTLQRKGNENTEKRDAMKRLVKLDPTPRHGLTKWERVL